MKSTDKILTPEELLNLLEDWKKEGKIVFTNGCFDILHIGHIDYLEKARDLGAKLIVGLNTDASIKRIKGPKRPINDETTRARILASLQFVDAVVKFSEDTPLNLIGTIKPDILVKGDDYDMKTIIGAEIVIAIGGEVKFIPLVKGYSTTNVITKIKEQL